MLSFFLGVCAVAFAGVTLTLIMAGRSLVWDTDGRLLYFPFMVAEGEWLRDIAASLLGGDLAIPLYSFDIGFGADWLITASGNSNEPINLLAALCPPEASELALRYSCILEILSSGPHVLFLLF